MGSLSGCEGRKNSGMSVEPLAGPRLASPEDAGDPSESCAAGGVNKSSSNRTGETAWLARSSLATLSGGLVGRVFQGSIQIVLARLLGPSSYGLYGIGWALVRLANTIAPFGLNNAVIHLATQYKTMDHRFQSTVVKLSLALTLGIGGIIAVAMILAAPALAHDVYKNSSLLALFLIFALAVPLASGLKIVSAATRVSQSMKYSVYSEYLVQPASNLVLIICFYAIGWRLLGAAAATVISFAIGFVLALSYQRKLFPAQQAGYAPPYAEITRGLLHFSLVSWLAVTSVNLVPLVDRLLVGVFLPPAAVGIYQATAQASFLFGIIEGAFIAAIAPRFSFLHQAAQPDHLDHMYKVSTRWLAYGCIPFLLVLCSAPQEVLAALYGISYMSGSRPLTILSVTWFVAAVASPAGMLLLFTGRQKTYSFIAGGGLVICVVTTYVLIRRFGLVGAAFGTGTANVAIGLASVLAVGTKLRMWPWQRQWIKGILATAITAIALLLAGHLGVRPAPLDIAFLLSISTAVFAIALISLGLDDEDRVMIGTLRSYVAALASASNSRTAGGNL